MAAPKPLVDTGGQEAEEYRRYASMKRKMNYCESGPPNEALRELSRRHKKLRGRYLRLKKALRQQTEVHKRQENEENKSNNADENFKGYVTSIESQLRTQASLKVECPHGRRFPRTIRFSDMKPSLSQDTIKILSGMKFYYASPVQAGCIPLMMSYKDVTAEAVTGSGKTLAFVVPVCEVLRRERKSLQNLGSNDIAALILSPTRELARQVQEVAVPFVQKVAAMRTVLLIGGSKESNELQSEEGNLNRDEKKNLDELRCVVIIGTPGRVETAILKQKHYNVRHLEFLILDEADRLLDLGFEVQVTSILLSLPKQRRTGLFSATQTAAVKDLARAGLRNPVRVTVRDICSSGGNTENILPSSLEVFSVIRWPKHKLSFLVQFLRSHPNSKMIIYFLTCAMVDYFSIALPKLDSFQGTIFFHIHGKMKQKSREKSLRGFTESDRSSVLLATDVAARGLDIPDVDWIIQFDPPQDPSAFIHRVGRAGRMGREGSALVMLHPHESSYIEFLKLRKCPTTAMEDDCENGKVSNVEEDLAVHLCSRLRLLCERDRNVMEKGIVAFVSYVRGYEQHQCQYIFQLKELKIGQLATMLGLLTLPSMPELRGKLGKKLKLDVSGFTPSTLSIDAVQYKDKTRERARQNKMKNEGRLSDQVQSHDVREIKRKEAEPIAAHEEDHTDADDKEMELEWKAFRKEKKKRRKG